MFVNDLAGLNFLNRFLMFENVNDPYVIQRLYAIVFGACTKMHEEHHSEYHELAIYVYNTICNIFGVIFIYGLLQKIERTENQ